MPELASSTKPSRSRSRLTLPVSTGEGSTGVEVIGVLNSPADLPDNGSASPDVRRNSKSESRWKVPPTSRFKKSDSASTRQPRLSRTLKRPVSFRDLHEDDGKYFWLLYKLGKLEIFEKELNVNDFRQTLWNYIFKIYDFVWVLEAKTLKGYQPAGFVFGKILGPINEIGDMLWMPWATERNKLESSVNFLNDMRKTTTLVWQCEAQDREFFTHVCRYGIARRVGTLILPDKQLMEFQTRI